MAIDRRVPIADFRNARGHRRKREIARIAVVELVPLQRSRDASVRRGPYRVGGGNRAVLRVLVVVEEHPVTLFLPPFARGQRRDTVFDLASQGEGRTPYHLERP